ncbi:MAG TPA: hypothetical protein EYP33_03375 [Pyrodictium sp.]|nr:hypothetical protein [Pyrodictium sp.]
MVHGGADEETCEKHLARLRDFEWPLKLEALYETELTKWHIHAVRAYLNFLEERGYEVERWKRIRALQVPQSGEDLYIPKEDEVRKALETLQPHYRLVYSI